MRTDFFDYFGDKQDRYESRISLSKPLVIRLDGKNCTSNPQVKLTEPGEGCFPWALIKASQDISDKYRGLAYIALDEVSLIFTEPKLIQARVGSIKTQDIVAVISQELFLKFNEYYTGCKPIYFAATCFSIPSNKIISYLKYRKSSIINTNMVYFSKQNCLGFHVFNKSAEELRKKLMSKTDYGSQPIYAHEGVLAINKKLCKVSDYIDGKYTPVSVVTLAETTDDSGTVPIMITDYKKLEPANEEKMDTGIHGPAQKRSASNTPVFIDKEHGRELIKYKINEDKSAEREKTEHNAETIKCVSYKGNVPLDF